jgi:transketolase
VRTTFIETLCQLAEQEERIWLLTGDLGYSILERFANLFPERFVNVGVAEQNMVGVAAGLALSGKIVLTYSIANFATLRCLEQIRNDICYHRLNVKIVAVGGGLAYGSAGHTHHAVEDLAVMRAMPNMAVIAPGDPVETRLATRAMVGWQGPCYLRLGKTREATVHVTEPKFSWGKMLCAKEGRDTVILSTGAMLKYAYDFVHRHRPEWGLWSVPFLKPIDDESLFYIARNYHQIITIEEHQRSAGLGSAILEGMNDLRERKRIESIPMVKRVAIPDMFAGVAGTPDYLRSLWGLVLS